MRLCRAPAFSGFRNTHVDSRGFLVENLDRQPPDSARSLDDGFVFIHPLRRESVIRVSFFGRNADGNEVKSSFSTTTAATFSLGYAASFPATARGT